MTTTRPTIIINGRSYAIHVDGRSHLDCSSAAIRAHLDQLPNLPDLDHDDWRDDATDVTTDGGYYAVYEYDLCDGHRLYVDTDQRVIESVTVSNRSIRDHLLDWDWRAIGYLAAADWLGRFMEDPRLTPAPADYKGPCVVWREPHYYEGTCDAPRPSLDKDDEDEILVFHTRAAAEKWVSAYYNTPSEIEGIPACKIMEHGQYGPDTLTIVAWEG